MLIVFGVCRAQLHFRLADMTVILHRVDNALAAVRECEFLTNLKRSFAVVDLPAVHRYRHDFVYVYRVKELIELVRLSVWHCDSRRLVAESLHFPCAAVREVYCNFKIRDCARVYPFFFGVTGRSVCHDKTETVRREHESVETVISTAGNFLVYLTFDLRDIAVITYREEAVTERHLKRVNRFGGVNILQCLNNALFRSVIAYIRRRAFCRVVGKFIRYLIKICCTRSLFYRFIIAGLIANAQIYRVERISRDVNVLSVAVEPFVRGRVEG